MPDEQRTFRRAAEAALVCATLNAAATVAMAVLLRPGLPPAPPAVRLQYLHDHAPAWRCSWLLWIVTAVVLVLFYFRLHRALSAGWRGKIAIVVSFIGLAADALGDWIFIEHYPYVYKLSDFAWLDQWTAFLSGGLANGAYTLSWNLLAWREPLPRFHLLLFLPGLAGGYGLSISGFANWTPGLVIGTAVAIPCFTLWTFLVGRFFWKKAQGADTIAAHA